MIDNLQDFAEDCLKEYQIPALSVAVWKDGTLHQGAAGCLNLDTGVEATTDAIFQIGSITKVLTTCLVMKLVEQGRVELDAPVKTYLRRFQIADVEATHTITVRQLLNHTNGIAGDYFPDDAHEEGPHIARYLDRCAQLPLVHPVGEGFSYSNAAFAIAGHLVEVVSGMTWYDAIEEWIYQPLGMTQSICRPQEMIRFRTALGHIPDPDNEGQWRTGSGSFLTLGQAPAGSTLAMTAADLVTFGRAHLDKGLTQDEQPWLSAASIQLMQTPTVDVPVPSCVLKHRLGLGWFCYETVEGAHTFIDHGGATNGQLAMLRVFPAQNACFAVLLNSGNGHALNEITKKLTLALSGINSTEPEVAQKSLSKEQLQGFVGRYQAYAGVCHVRLEKDVLLMRYEDAVAESAASELSLQPLSETDFELRSKTDRPAGRLHFVTPDTNGVPTQLFFAMRLHARS